MTDSEYRQKDYEYGKVVLDALSLQHACEMANMPRQAAQAREMRRQAAQRQTAMSLVFGPKTEVAMIATTPSTMIAMIRGKNSSLLRINAADVIVANARSRGSARGGDAAGLAITHA